MKQQNISYTTCKSRGTVIYVAVDGSFAGSIVISDRIKEGAKEAIASMKKIGVKRCVMLTGDRKEAAEQVASEIGIDEVHAELLPGDKVAKVEELLNKESDKERLAFVGDGINDAPVLSRADIGIAMGSMGSDAAIEAADVVLMDDDITQDCLHREDFQKDPPHRPPEYRFCSGCQGSGADSGRSWYGKHVGSCFRRCRSFRYCNPELHACAEN